MLANMQTISFIQYPSLDPHIWESIAVEGAYPEAVKL